MNRVLVVDDDGGMRAALEARFLRRGWQVETAANAPQALERFRSGMHPLIVTDIRMPGEDGLFLMRAARALVPHTAVILLTAFANVPEAVSAMKDGACDYVPKSLSSTSLDILHIRSDLITKIRAAAQSRKPRPMDVRARKPPRSQSEIRSGAGHATPAIVALGTSTGGPKALQEILPLFPRDLSVPILIVQHMPPGFTAPFAQRLNTLCSLSVREASHGETLLPGVAYIAPSGLHMSIERLSDSQAIICLDQHPENYLHIPSVDVLMKSVAEAFRNLALGVIMTGMGSDGAAGMQSIHRQGGLTIGQDEATCTVYGMPRACAELGVLDRIVPLPQIPSQILHATRYRRLA